MSDRRERVAKAMYLSEYLPLDENAAATWDRYSPEYSNIKQRWLSLADAALAVMEAEPTEAEVDVAADAYLDSMPEHIALDCAFVYPGAIRAALTAFLAARTARP